MTDKISKEANFADFTLQKSWQVIAWLLTNLTTFQSGLTSGPPYTLHLYWTTWMETSQNSAVVFV